MYSYRKLLGRITEVFVTKENFAKALGISPCTLSGKLSGKSEWTQGEMVRALEVLEIPLRNIREYFFE